MVLNAAVTTATAAEWTERATQIKTFMLPSGVVVRGRLLNMLDLAHLGHIELTLVNNVMQTAIALQAPLRKQVDGRTPSDLELLKDEDLLRMLELFRKVAVTALVEPQVAFNPQEASVMDVTKIPFDDLSTIFASTVTGGANSLAPFRR